MKGGNKVAFEKRPRGDSRMFIWEKKFSSKTVMQRPRGRAKPGAFKGQEEGHVAGNVEKNEVGEVVMRRVSRSHRASEVTVRTLTFALSEMMCPCTVLDREVTCVLTYVLQGIPLAVVLRTHPGVGGKWKPGDWGVTVVCAGFGDRRYGSILKMEPKGSPSAPGPEETGV